VSRLGFPRATREERVRKEICPALLVGSGLRQGEGRCFMGSGRKALLHNLFVGQRAN